MLRGIVTEKLRILIIRGCASQICKDTEIILALWHRLAANIKLYAARQESPEAEYLFSILVTAEILCLLQSNYGEHHPVFEETGAKSSYGGCHLFLERFQVDVDFILQPIPRRREILS